MLHTTSVSFQREQDKLLVLEAENAPQVGHIGIQNINIWLNK